MDGAPVPPVEYTDAPLRKGLAHGLDYVLTTLVPSADVVEVSLGAGSASRRRERLRDMRDFNTFMLWMKRSDRALYDTVSRM
jgi:hypothetical protein